MEYKPEKISVQDAWKLAKTLWAVHKFVIVKKSPMKETFYTVIEKNKDKSYKYTINIDFGSKIYDTYGIFEHEISHIFFSKSISKVIKLLQQQTQITEEFIKDIVNILEDERVESLWGEIYYGSNYRFQYNKEQLYKKLKREIYKKEISLDNPIIRLALARSGHTEMLDENEAKYLNQLINYVRGKSPEAIYAAAKSFIIKYEKQLKGEIQQSNNFKSSPNQANKSNAGEGIKNDLVKSLFGENNDNDNDENEGEDNDSSDFDSEEAEELFKSINGTKKLNNLDDLFDDTLKFTKKVFDYKDEELLEQEGDEHLNDDLLDKIKSMLELDSDISSLVIDSELIEKMSSKAEEEVEEVKEVLSKLRKTTASIHPSNLAKSKAKEEKLSPSNDCDININSSKLSEILSMFRTIKKIKHEEEGDIDIESYIQFLAGQRDIDLFINESENPGLSIMFSLDCSGSMAGQLDSLRTAVKIMFELESRMNGLIEFSAYTWNFIGNYTNKFINIGLVDKDSVCSIHSAGMTPTLEAVRYGIAKMKYNKTDRKKVLVVMTDGTPSVRGSTEWYRKQMFKEISDAQKNGISVIFLVFGNYLNDFVPQQNIIMVRNKTIEQALIETFIRVLRRYA